VYFVSFGGMSAFRLFYIVPDGDVRYEEWIGRRGLWCFVFLRRVVDCCDVSVESLLVLIRISIYVKQNQLF